MLHVSDASGPTVTTAGPLTAEGIERAAQALWRLDWPEDDQFSEAAPNDWNEWPETPRGASLAHVEHSKAEYREQARVALEAAING